MMNKRNRKQLTICVLFCFVKIIFKWWTLWCRDVCYVVYISRCVKYLCDILLFGNCPIELRYSKIKAKGIFSPPGMLGPAVPQLHFPPFPSPSFLPALLPVFPPPPIGVAPAFPWIPCIWSFLGNTQGRTVKQVTGNKASWFLQQLDEGQSLGEGSV